MAKRHRRRKRNPARSEKQRRLFAVARSIQKGKRRGRKASRAARRIARTVKPKVVEKFMRRNPRKRKAQTMRTICRRRARVCPPFGGRAAGLFATKRRKVRQNPRRARATRHFGIAVGRKVIVLAGSSPGHAHSVGLFTRKGLQNWARRNQIKVR